MEEVFPQCPQTQIYAANRSAVNASILLEKITVPTEATPHRAQAQLQKQSRSLFPGSQHLYPPARPDRAVCHWEHFAGNCWVYRGDRTQAALFSREKTATGN